MTWVATTSPTRRPAAAPDSTALLTAPTSPRTIHVTRPASIFSQPTSNTFADFTAASAASIIATRPRHSIIPKASRSILIALRIGDARIALITQAVHRCRNPTTAANKLIGRKTIHRHDRRAAQQTAELNHLANLAAGHRNDAHGGGLVVHHADCHLVSDDRSDRFRRGRSGHRDHVDPDRTNAGPGFQLFE